MERFKDELRLLLQISVQSYYKKLELPRFLTKIIVFACKIRNKLVHFAKFPFFCHTITKEAPSLTLPSLFHIRQALL